MTTEELAQMFHDTYERLAPQFGYKTREASAVAWEHVPDTNKRLMIAVAHEIIQHLSVRNMVQWEPPTIKNIGNEPLSHKIE